MNVYELKIIASRQWWNNVNNVIVGVVEVIEEENHSSAKNLE